MFKSWLSRLIAQEVNAQLTVMNKPKSIKDIRRSLAMMKDGKVEHIFEIHRIKGRFAKRPK